MKASIQVIEGTPALFLNGCRTLPVLYGLSDIPASAANTAQAAGCIADFAKAGISLVAADTSLHLGWHRVTPFDPSPLLAEIAAVRDANPDAAILLRLHLNPPYHFLRDHPEEQVVYRTESGDVLGIDDGEQDRLIAHDGDRHMRASLASTVWREAAAARLRAFLNVLSARPEGEAVFAVQVAYGVYGEWHEWGCDVSAPMRAAHRRLLTQKYQTDAALRTAWGREDVCLSNPPFHPEIFRPTEDGLFRDPTAARITADSQETLMRVTAEDILYFCRIVKEETPDLLAGAFYGYFLCGGGSHIVNMGHLALPYLLEQADGCIDFLAGPFAYGDSRRPDRTPSERALMESLRLHGILWLSEMDQHPAGAEYAIGGDPMREDETIALLRRNVLRPLMAGMGCWYYDHRLVPMVLGGQESDPLAASVYRKTGWWSNPISMQEIAKIQEIAKKCLHSNGVADVLVVYDLDTLYDMYTAPYPDELLHDALGKSGAVYDTILLSDLARCDLARYRLLIFANTYRIRPAAIPLIHAAVREKTAVFLYAAGFSDGDHLSEEHIAAVTGFRVARCTPSARVRLEGGDFWHNPYGAPDPAFCITGLVGCEGMRPSSDRARISPLRPVGYYEADDTPTISYPKRDEALSSPVVIPHAIAAAVCENIWYLAAPCPTPNLLRRICREAGVHLYTEAGEPLWANDRLILFHTVTGGERTFTLRGGRQVTHHLPPMTTLAMDAQSGEAL